MCGQIIAYQGGSTDAFHNAINWGQTTIDSAYVDGVSLTHGPAGSRQHIWTFTAALYEESPTFLPRLTCACTNTRYNWPYQVPAFIGTISVTLGILDLIQDLALILLMTLSGMVKDVAPSILVASLILLHGSRRHYHRLPVMTLKYVSAMVKQDSMRRILLLI